ncbi:DUF2750 domain-containing protein [Hazenella sp. IB182353]|uniref:DUF2750 domain-containing protein n=1 Tax=Polycladospora coralii TaxID=2771432 RepID=UPI001747AAEF|nr:DUF2750 domain-containing protein [Polycladospora coralii]MBS7531573.1 DUF2750 domain-containing protein [Polycladospora coralii]
MSISEEQLTAVLALSGPKRYSHFIGRVVNFEEAWGLWNDGWALAQTDEQQLAFPLWPAREYAQKCATGDWINYKPEIIPLEDLMHELLPILRNDGVLPAVFMTPHEKGVTPTVEEFLKDLEFELTKY